MRAPVEELQELQALQEKEKAEDEEDEDWAAGFRSRTESTASCDDDKEGDDPEVELYFRSLVLVQTHQDTGRVWIGQEEEAHLRHLCALWDEVLQQLEDQAFDSLITTDPRHVRLLEQEREFSRQFGGWRPPAPPQATLGPQPTDRPAFQSTYSATPGLG